MTENTRNPEFKAKLDQVRAVLEWMPAEGVYAVVGVSVYEKVTAHLQTCYMARQVVFDPNVPASRVGGILDLVAKDLIDKTIAAHAEKERTPHIQRMAKYRDN